MATSNIRYGPGITREIGMDLVDRGIRRVLVVTDALLATLPPVQNVLASLEGEGIAFDVFDRVRVEPTDVSMKEAVAFAQQGDYEGFVAVGGGSVMDTAKVANLYATHPVDNFLHYVNAPIGAGAPIPGPLKPLIAVPTTSGTGSETTGVAIFDLLEMHAKTGIAHRFMKPTIGLVDPDNTKTLPPEIAVSTGLDVLSHAIESYTAIPFDTRPHPDRPLLRPAYQGSNPISDLWALQALRMVATYLPRVAKDMQDDEARGMMLLASSYAGIGFGNAGVHLPHGMSYPVSGMVRDYRPRGYQIDRPLIPHGTSVILNAPAVFRYTAPANPDRHLKAAAALGVDIRKAQPADAGPILADRIIELMQLLDTPSGLKEVGFTSADIPKLVEGTLPQHRVTKLAPKPAEADALHALFEDAMQYW